MGHLGNITIYRSNRHSFAQSLLRLVSFLQRKPCVFGRKKTSISPTLHNKTPNRQVNHQVPKKNTSKWEHIQIIQAVEMVKNHVKTPMFQQVEANKTLPPYPPAYPGCGAWNSHETWQVYEAQNMLMSSDQWSGLTSVIHGGKCFSGEGIFITSQHGNPITKLFIPVAFRIPGGMFFLQNPTASVFERIRNTEKLSCFNFRCFFPKEKCDWNTKNW